MKSTANAIRPNWDPKVEELGLAHIPNILLSANRYIARNELKISPTEMWVLASLIFLSQQQNDFPVLKKDFLADNLSLSPRQIQRSLSSLETKGYISKITRYNNNIRTSNGYDLTGTIRLLKKIASAAKNNSKIDLAA